MSALRANDRAPYPLDEYEAATLEAMQYEIRHAQDGLPSTPSLMKSPSALSGAQVRGAANPGVGTRGRQPLHHAEGQETDELQGSPTDPPSETAERRALRALLGDLAVIAVLAVCVSVGVYAVMAPSPAFPPLQVAIVDTERLAREAIDALGEAVVQQTLDPRQMPERSQRFSEALLREIDVYAQQGILVVRHAAVLAVPGDVPDITEALRQRLLDQGAMMAPPSTGEGRTP